MSEYSRYWIESQVEKLVPKLPKPQMSEKEKFAQEIINREHKCRKRKKNEPLELVKIETGIGTRIVLKCKCQRKFDITDYSVW